MVMRNAFEGLATVGRQDTLITLLTKTLTERMMARAPAENYSLWLDIGDANFMYLAEAPSAATETAGTFRGVRIPLNANGDPVGKVEQAINFVWATRGTAAWS